MAARQAPEARRLAAQAELAEPRPEEQLEQLAWQAAQEAPPEEPAERALAAAAVPRQVAALAQLVQRRVVLVAPEA